MAKEETDRQGFLRVLHHPQRPPEHESSVCMSTADTVPHNAADFVDRTTREASIGCRCIALYVRVLRWCLAYNQF